MEVSPLSTTCSYIPFCESMADSVSDFPIYKIAGALFFSYVVAIAYNSWSIGLSPKNFTQAGVDAPETEEDTIQLVRRMAALNPYLLFSNELSEENPSFLSNEYPCTITDVDVEPNIEYKSVDKYLCAKTGSVTYPFTNGDVIGLINREMKKALECKFGLRLPSEDGEVFKRGLLATGQTYLVYHLPRKGQNAHLSDDFDGTGNNELGKRLMKIRKACGGTGVVPRPRELDVFYRRSLGT